MLKGWGVRPNDYQYTFTVQQQLLPRVSLDASVTHRTFHGFFITTDLSKHAGGVLSGSPAGSYETYTLTAPLDDRLAGGGGYPVTVYSPTAAANAVAAVPFLVRESDLGAERDSHWDGVEFTVNARLRGGLTAQVGSSTGRGVVNTCETTTLVCADRSDEYRVGRPRPARLQQHGTVAVDDQRAGELHDSEGGRAGQRDGAIAAGDRRSPRHGRCRTR